MRFHLCKHADFAKHNNQNGQAGHLLLRPVAGQASNEQLVRAVCHHGANHVQTLQRHRGVGLCGAQQHGHVVVIVVGPPHLQEDAAQMSEGSLAGGQLYQAGSASEGNLQCGHAC